MKMCRMKELIGIDGDEISFDILQDATGHGMNLEGSFATDDDEELAKKHGLILDNELLGLLFELYQKY